MQLEVDQTGEPLSKREKQVAAKISEGLSNRSIADQLFISERTVKFHCTNIFKKLAITNRKMLISMFAGNGLQSQM